MNDQAHSPAEILPPAVPPLPRAQQPQPQQQPLPLAKCMVVFLFQVPEQPEIHTGRIFLQGVANLNTQLAVEQTEKAILDHHAGAMSGVTVIDWKRLDG